MSRQPIDAWAAEEAMKDAQKLFSRIVQDLWPIGSTVRVQVGSSITRVKVSGYGSYWANPGRVLGVNVETGKKRKFHYTAILKDERP